MEDAARRGGAGIDEAFERAEDAGLVVYRIHEWAELTCERCGDSRDVPLTSRQPHIQVKQIDRFTSNHSH